MQDLTGKVAVVTGGGKGIGRHYCLALAGAGASVVIADIDLEAANAVADELKAQGGKAQAVKADVADEQSVAEMAKAIEVEFGRVDIIVNNAALFVTLPQKKFWEYKAADWDKVLAINVKGVALVSAALLPLMWPQGKGKIINIASGVAIKGRPNRLHYVASKGAVVSMTRAMARELGEFNINVNAIAPGQTVTETYLQVEPEEYFQKAIPERALKRLATPEDLVGTLLFLASSASDFTTGQTMAVDGGAVML